MQVNFSQNINFVLLLIYSVVIIQKKKKPKHLHTNYQIGFIDFNSGI